MPETLSQAIAREEGFYVHGTRAFRNNNPGNIEWGAFARAHNATHGDPRFAVFPTWGDGFRCLEALLTHYGNISIAAAIAKWAPPSENNTSSYIRNVCSWMEQQPDTILTQELIGVGAATYNEKV